MAIKIVTEQEFYQWVQDLNNSWQNRSKMYRNLVKLDVNGNVAICNPKTQKICIAKRYKSDVYDARIGLAVAWAKYRNMQIPKIGELVSSFNDLQFGDTFAIGSNTAFEYIFCGIIFDENRYKVIVKVTTKDKLIWWYTTDYKAAKIYRTGSMMK